MSADAAAGAGTPARAGTPREVERLHVDWTRCDRRGACTELLPELLAEDDWGYPVSTTGEVAPAVPRRLQGAARLAVRECPRLALGLRTRPERPPGTTA